jgi:hypothetical protein
VTLTNGFGNNWMARVRPGRRGQQQLRQFVYVGAGVTTRTWTVTAPSTPGNYEFRLFKQGSFILAATSPTVVVAAPPAPVLTVNATAVGGGQSVTVTLTTGKAAPRTICPLQPQARLTTAISTSRTSAPASRHARGR